MPAMMGRTPWFTMLVAIQAFVAWSRANTSAAATTIKIINRRRPDPELERIDVIPINRLQSPRVLLLLAIYAQQRAWPGFQTRRVDWLAAVRALAVRARLDARQRLVHLVQVALGAPLQGQHRLLLESLVGVVGHVVAHAAALWVQVVPIFRDLVNLDIDVVQQLRSFLLESPLD